MERAFEQYSKETEDLRRASFSLCGWMKSGDIQILLESYNFSEKWDSHIAGIEFQRPWSVWKPPYRTYEVLWKFIQNDIQFLNKNKKECDYTRQKKNLLHQVRLQKMNLLSPDIEYTRWYCKSLCEMMMNYEWSNCCSRFRAVIWSCYRENFNNLCMRKKEYYIGNSRRYILDVPAYERYR